MADVNNKLRLQIVTQLDAAGIKATKEQVDALELGIRRAGNAGKESSQKFGQLENALGKLPGPFGEIGKAMGGLAGQATLVIGAFSMGVDIGNKIVDKILKPLKLIPDAVAEIKKENTEYADAVTQLGNAIEIARAAEEKRLEASAEAAAKGIKAIDDQTAAYFRQVTALNNLKKAGNSAEMMQLQRDRFEDMRIYTEVGNTEAAEQVSKYYDVLEAALTAKQEMAEFDRQSASLTKEISKAEEAYALSAERAAEAKADQQRKEAALARFRESHGIGGNAFYTNQMDEMRDNDLERAATKAKRTAEAAEAAMAKRAQRLENIDAEGLQRRMERANLAAAGSLGIDRAAAAYDDFIASSGNPLNAQVDSTWAEELAKNAEESRETQKAMLDEIRGFGSKLEQLLELK